MKPIELPWIKYGYKLFAYEGPQGLKVERLAKGVGKNKSSFYHHFADTEVFTHLLLDYHLEQANLIAEKESGSGSLEDLITIMVEHKIDLLFNRQLRIHRENPAFADCFLKTNQITASAIAGIWANIIGLEGNSYLAGLVLKLSMENFYLQITDETLNPEWLQGYFQELRQTVQAFKQAGTIPSLDGSV